MFLLNAKLQTPKSVDSQWEIGEWPAELAEYGEQELKLVCNKFRFPYNCQLMECYRDYKDTRGGISENA